MVTLIKLLGELQKDQRGSELLEMMIAIVIVVLVVISPMQNLANALLAGFQKIISQLSNL